MASLPVKAPCRIVAKIPCKTIQIFLRSAAHIRSVALHASASASRSKNAELVQGLWQQVQRETTPWVADLIYPMAGVKDTLYEEARRAPSAPPTALADPDGRFCDTLPCGVSIHYKERLPACNSATHSDTAAPTLVFIHGFNASTFSWRANMNVIADATRMRGVAYDRPPFGLSERPLHWGKPGQKLRFNPYEINGNVQITEELLDSLGIGPVVLVGHSAGALVALEMLRRRPGQVAALALVAPAVPTTPEHSFQRRATFGSQLRLLATRAILASDTAGLHFVQRQILQQRERVSNGDLGFVPHPSTASVSSVDHLHSLDDGNVALRQAIDGYLLPLQAQDWDRAALLNLRAFALPMSFDYDSVHVPVLVVQGRKDRGLAQNARALADILETRSGLVPEMTSYVELDCGHVPMEEVPAQFNDALIHFLRSQRING